MRYTKSLLALLIICALAAPALGQMPQIVHQPYFPKHFLGVDKSSQKLYLYAQRSPSQILRQYTCSTGGKTGDKLLEGDKKTPEGIYFLERRIKHDLDFELYGDLAFTLNYPNPMDKIQDKTGHSIWIHGRGKQLVPRDTRGCVAIETDHLQELTPYIDLLQTPVIIGNKLNRLHLETEIPATAKELHSQVRDWARAWSAGSERFFDFYQSDKFSRSGAGPFQEFQSQKQELFKRYAWIEIFLDQIRVIPGPDYWVTYFGQYFRSPSFTSQGIKRLYWQKDGSKWIIVGREWRPKDLDLESKYLQNRKKHLRQWLESWRETWENADLEDYKSYYQPRARQDHLQGQKRILQEKKKIWEQDPPQSINLQDIQVELHPKGFRLSFQQSYTGASGYSDLGRKVLIVQPGLESFKILRETWKSL
ncbi:MAG: murein L,D-transpeptidase family protein [Desulfohalobiaceae bacterium]